MPVVRAPHLQLSAFQDEPRFSMTERKAEMRGGLVETKHNDARLGVERRWVPVVRAPHLQLTAFRGWGSGFRVEGLGLKVWGVGFRV